jgi:alpha-ribazole phosphatase
MPAIGIGAVAARLPRDAAWITSGARRCTQTAQTLAAACGQAPALHVEPDLAEQDFGAWQGRTHDEIAAAEPEAAARFWQDPAGCAPPGGESFAATLTRVVESIERLAATHGARDLVLVAHAGTVRAALAHAVGLAPAAALRFAIDPLSLTRLDRFAPSAEHGAAEWRVTCVNLSAPPAAASSES